MIHLLNFECHNCVRLAHIMYVLYVHDLLHFQSLWQKLRIFRMHVSACVMHMRKYVKTPQIRVRVPVLCGARDECVMSGDY
jgi:hypothetical protein